METTFLMQGLHMRLSPESDSPKQNATQIAAQIAANTTDPATVVKKFQVNFTCDLWEIL
jgi:hypothetical protein